MHRSFGYSADMDQAPSRSEDCQSGDEQNRPADCIPGSTDLATTVYATLRAMAQRQMQGERPGHTLSATALVHEAYLKLSGTELAGLPPARFYQAAAEAMRRILIDSARRRNAGKRGGGLRRVPDVQSVLDLAVNGSPEEILALEEAIQRLEKEDPEAAGVVRLRFFAGLSGDQAAEALGISPRQADREWAFARAFLHRALQDASGA
jgi:RNA polymerase sigma factor (TIGR02999 family)